MAADSSNESNDRTNRKRLRLQRARSIGWFVFFIVNCAFVVSLMFQFQDARSYTTSIEHGWSAYFASSKGTSTHLDGPGEHKLPSDGTVNAYRTGPVSFDGNIQIVQNKRFYNWDKTQTVTVSFRGSIDITDKLVERTASSSLTDSIARSLSAAVEEHYGDYDEESFNESVINTAEAEFTTRTGLSFSELSVVSVDHSEDKKKAYQTVHLNEDVFHQVPVEKHLDLEPLYPTLAILGGIDFLLIITIAVFPEALMPLVVLSLAFCPLAVAAGANRSARRVQEDAAACGDCCDPMCCACSCPIGDGDGCGDCGDCGDCGACGDCGDCGGCDGCGDCGGCDCC